MASRSDSTLRSNPLSPTSRSQIPFARNGGRAPAERTGKADEQHFRMLVQSVSDYAIFMLDPQLRAVAPDLPVLILSMHDESLYAERALRAGARGYIMKQEAPQTLLSAIRKVLTGEVYVSEKMGATLLQRIVGGKKSGADLPMDRLTDRELEVFSMIGTGQSMKEIADKLCLSVKTVEAHREHIKQKLNLKSSAELIRFAIRNAPGMA